MEALFIFVFTVAGTVFLENIIETICFDVCALHNRFLISSVFLLKSIVLYD